MYMCTHGVREGLQTSPVYSDSKQVPHLQVRILRDPEARTPLPVVGGLSTIYTQLCWFPSVFCKLVSLS